MGAPDGSRNDQVSEEGVEVMTSVTTDQQTERLTRLREAAYRIRRYALDMGEVQGQGYIGQALGVADVLAVVYGDQLRFRPR